MERTERRHSMHYCRECEFFVKPTGRGSFASAHILINAHIIEEHDRERERLCGRYCQEAEQSEERSAGHKLYGPGAKSFPAPIKTYEQLFPVEKDDHS